MRAPSCLVTLSQLRAYEFRTASSALSKALSCGANASSWGGFT
jgi:hypothetical protein